MQNPFVRAAMMAAALARLPEVIAHRALRLERRREEIHLGKTGRRYKPNGDAECARRRRQIASGQLTVSNGLERGPV